MCSGLQSPVFRIPRAKVSLNRESGFPYMERSKQKQFGSQGKSCYTVKRFFKNTNSSNVIPDASG